VTRVGEQRPDLLPDDRAAGLAQALHLPELRQRGLETLDLRGLSTAVDAFEDDQASPHGAHDSEIDRAVARLRVIPRARLSQTYQVSMMHAS
jgi:hypothetical protein